MRKWIVMVCLVTTTLTGCARQRPEFVPPNTDRAELTAAIAHQGEPLQPGEQIVEPPPPPEGKLEKAGRKTMYYIGVAGVCVAATAVCVAILYLHSRTHEPLEP